MYMKKTLALVLTFVLLMMGSAFALDIESVIGMTEEHDISFALAEHYKDAKPLFTYELLQPGSVTAKLIDNETGEVFTTFFTDEQQAVGKHTLMWHGLNDEGTHPAGSPEKPINKVYTYQITVNVNGNTIVGNFGPLDWLWMHSIEDDLAVTETWYPDNTICVAGLEFREMKPELTNKWYNFLPIDLSIQGTQTFDLIASNLYIIGKVIVKVDGDNVTVNWELIHKNCCNANYLYRNEFFTFFHDLDSVKSVEPLDMLDQGHAFGKALSISKDLDGDTNVLLYIRNMATYCNMYCNVNGTAKFYNRYWPNLPADRKSVV